MHGLLQDIAICSIAAWALGVLAHFARQPVILAYSELLDLIWIAPLAVVVVAGSFSLALLGATRAGEERRAGRGGTATAYGLLAGLAGLVIAASVIAGVGVIVAG